MCLPCLALLLLAVCFLKSAHFAVVRVRDRIQQRLIRLLGIQDYFTVMSTSDCADWHNDIEPKTLSQYCRVFASALLIETITVGVYCLLAQVAAVTSWHFAPSRVTMALQSSLEP